MNKDLVTFYSDECPTCDSWDIRVVEDEWIESDNGWEVVIQCRECGYEWDDFIQE